MLQLFFTLHVLFASVRFETAFANGNSKHALNAQQLYRTAVGASQKCRGFDVRSYIRYGEDHMEGWRQFFKLRTADDLINENYLSCLSDELCNSRSPRDIDQAKKAYNNARRSCSHRPEEDTLIGEEADLDLETTELQSIDSEIIPTTNQSTRLVSFTVENLIYFMAGALLGAICGTYLSLNFQRSELPKSLKMRRPEL